MASTTTNGVVLELPYAILRNFREVRPYSVGVVSRDGITRRISTTDKDVDRGVFVYNGDKVIFELQAPANGANVPTFDVIRVDTSTGAEITSQTVVIPAYWMRRMQATLSIASNGTVTVNATYS